MNRIQHCGIIPGYLLRRIAQAEPQLAPAMELTLREAEAIRAHREMLATRWPGGHPPVPGQLPDPTRSAPNRGPDFRSAGWSPPGLRSGQPEDLVDLPRAPEDPLHPQEQGGEGAVEAEKPLQLPDRTPLPETARPDRRVHDAGYGTDLPGIPVRGEDDPETGEISVDQAFDGLGATWEVLARVFGWDSLDGQGKPMIATVHYGKDYANAFWDGRQMVFGDGDGVYFKTFTGSVDVIAHELAHGMTQFTAGLTYVGQSGALNESASDVWGAIVRQWVRGETVTEADWLIGADLFTDRVQGVALRSMSAPGKAYDDPVLGTDPQPGHMDDYVHLPHDAANDNGGVHINSGIINKAFHLFATDLGGKVWERAGQVWFDTMTTPGLIPRDCDFATFVGATLACARARYGTDSAEVEALVGAWEGVGLSGEPGLA